MTDSRKYTPPDSRIELDALAEQLLDASGCRDVLPTPLEQIAAIKNLELVTEDDSIIDYMKRLTKKSKKVFVSAREKLRGASDLRNSIIFVPTNTNRTSTRERFATGHEIAHQFIDWHHISPHGFLDDEKTLSPQITDEFEKEANYLGASLIYQGDAFIRKTRSVKPTISAILDFAQMHDASFMATAWQFVNASDEAVAVGYYFPRDTHLGINSPMFKLWKIVPSHKFEKTFDIDEAMPDFLPNNHAIVELALESSPDEYQLLNMQIDQKSVRMQVQAHWNSYTLNVLFRRPPILRNVLNQFTTQLK